eukprot:CCRYP_005158-RB/>CCRYP_005158-RB protein AED:0.21 eAED:0.21 QI:223/1/1/1/0.33/0.25/4/895/62
MWYLSCTKNRRLDSAGQNLLFQHYDSVAASVTNERNAGRYIHCCGGLYILTRYAMLEQDDWF